MSGEYQEDLRSMIQKQTRWPRPTPDNLNIEALIAAFREMVQDFRTTIVKNLGLNTDQTVELDSVLNELQRLMEQDADKYMIAPGLLTDVKVIFEINKTSTDLDMILDDLRERCITHLQQQVVSLKSIHDYEPDPAGGWRLKRKED